MFNRNTLIPFSLLLLLSGLCSLVASPSSTSPNMGAPKQPSGDTQQNFPPIRSFEVETLAKLGCDIYRQDKYAWIATDVMFECVGKERMRAEGVQGWVVDESNAIALVRFLRKNGEEMESAYDVRCPKDKKPYLEVPRERSLTPFQRLRYLAFCSAHQGMMKGHYPLCKVNSSYNKVVLDDPTGKGFLVYFLRPKENKDEVPIGGNYRVSIDSDGKTVTQVDRLSASCLTLNLPQGNLRGGKKPDYMMTTHLVSNTPLETHVFASLQEGLPLYVGTPDGRIWVTDKGKIIFLDTLSHLETDPDKSKSLAK